jgi:hypothetical protein
VNVKILIDSIVQQTTVLLAQLATAGGVRAPLAHVANQVFLELTRELDAQGVSRKVSADMFGMALRSCLRRIQGLSESSTERGRAVARATRRAVRAHRAPQRGARPSRGLRSSGRLRRATCLAASPRG